MATSLRRMSAAATLDYIVVNPALAAEHVEGSTRVIDTEADSGDRPSDHRPVVAEFVAADL